MNTEDRVRELNDAAVLALVNSHLQRADEPLLLGVRFRLDDPLDIHLLEVVGHFPGGDEDELLEFDYEPSARLRILGKLHLVLGSPAQLRSALKSKDPRIDAVRQGKVLVAAGPEAEALRRELGL